MRPSDKSSLRMKWVGWKPEWRMIREIILIGLPAMATMSATSLTMLGINWALVLYGGEIQIAIFGIINRFIFFVVMPINGIVQGMQPIIGFNYGAARTDRVIRTFWWCTSAATGAAILAWIAVMLVPGFFMRIFSANPEVVQNGSEALRWIFMMTPLTGLPIVAGGLYQAMGIADRAFLLTTARSVLFLIPLVFILPSYLELKGVWISFAMSDALAFLLSVFILLKDWKRLF